ncbi:MAG: hypothetical protein M1839_004347 [Geoglossum umbratile]|nr:MAG: hypothetical protein M1839_004347 [Geoglossum umbratile]
MIIPAKDTARVLGLAENQNNINTTLLDRLAEEISQAVFTALAASTKRSSDRATGQPWWDATCNEAVRAYKRKRAHLRFLASLGIEAQEELIETNRAKAELRWTTRYAKYTYWQKRINDSLQSTKVFQMTK